jgi:hypothetical protein
MPLSPPGAVAQSISKRRQPNMRYSLAPAILAVLAVLAAVAGDLGTYWP